MKISKAFQFNNLKEITEEFTVWHWINKFIEILFQYQKPNKKNQIKKN